MPTGAIFRKDCSCCIYLDHILSNELEVHTPAINTRLLFRKANMCLYIHTETKLCSANNSWFSPDVDSFDRSVKRLFGFWDMEDKNGAGLLEEALKGLPILKNKSGRVQRTTFYLEQEKYDISLNTTNWNKYTYTFCSHAAWMIQSSKLCK